MASTRAGLPRRTEQLKPQSLGLMETEQLMAYRIYLNYNGNNALVDKTSP